MCGMNGVCVNASEQECSGYTGEVANDRSTMHIRAWPKQRLSAERQRSREQSRRTNPSAVFGVARSKLLGNDS